MKDFFNSLHELETHLKGLGLMAISEGLGFEAQLTFKGLMSFLDALALGEDCQGEFKEAFEVTKDESFLEAQIVTIAFVGLRDFIKDNSKPFSYKTHVFEVGAVERVANVVPIEALREYINKHGFTVNEFSSLWHTLN